MRATVARIDRGGARRVKADEQKKQPKRKRRPSAAVQQQLRCREAGEKLNQTKRYSGAKKAQRTADAPQRESAAEEKPERPRPAQWKQPRWRTHKRYYFFVAYFLAAIRERRQVGRGY